MKDECAKKEKGKQMVLFFYDTGIDYLHDILDRSDSSFYWNKFYGLDRNEKIVGRQFSRTEKLQKFIRGFDFTHYDQE